MERVKETVLGEGAVQAVHHGVDQHGVPEMPVRTQRLRGRERLGLVSHCEQEHGEHGEPDKHAGVDEMRRELGGLCVCACMRVWVSDGDAGRSE